jgi:N-alpha-acetyl-L-2,4-diaminobutyrate deacetylase
VRNVLIHAGILSGEAETEPTIDLDMPDSECFVFSEHDGLLEPLVTLGQRIVSGQALARIWPADRTGIEPVTMTARREGLLAARHFPGLVKAGDCLAVVAVPLS